MTLIYPMALFALIPMLVVSLWLGRRVATTGLALPGDWPKAIAAPLRALMTRATIRGATSDTWLVTGLAVVIIVAIARPTIPLDQSQSFTNIAGRVIALDLGSGADIHSQRHAVHTLMADAPGVPTALVVATGDAFDVVPLTTDAAFIERYLNVVAPDVMPLEGRSMAVALTHSEDILAQANIVVGQIILVSGGTAPDPQARPATRWQRAVIVPDRAEGNWSGYADDIDARLRTYDDLADISREFLHAIEKVRLHSDPESHIEITPYLTGLALLLWAGLFRRRRAI